uniref:Uncharacterized protein n=1 Tax=Anguilla anguilla TaxID=7936 RepID=A0A0E9TEN1_ANGAN
MSHKYTRYIFIKHKIFFSFITLASV